MASSTKRYYQQITRFSAVLALVTDVSMGVLGGQLKRRENTSARIGDVLSYLYLGSAVLKRFEDQGRPEQDDSIHALGESILLVSITRKFVRIVCQLSCATDWHTAARGHFSDWPLFYHALR